MNFSDQAKQEILTAQIEVAKRADGNVVFSSGDPDVDAALAAPMVPESTMQKDYRTVYDTETGEPRNIPISLLSKTLVKRRMDPVTNRQVPAFSMNPTKEYVRGNVMCYLHPDHPDYMSLRAIGLSGKVCGGGETAPAAHLATEFDRDLHMQHRHSREWEAIKSYRERRQREEEMELRRAEVEAMKAMAAGNQRGRGAA